MQDGGSITLKVVNKIADRKGVDPVELTPPLHSIVNTEALDSLFESTDGSDGTNGDLEFEYQGYTVRVDSAGGVQVINSSDSSATTRNSAANPVQD